VWHVSTTDSGGVQKKYRKKASGAVIKESKRGLHREEPKKNKNSKKTKGRGGEGRVGRRARIERRNHVGKSSVVTSGRQEKKKGGGSCNKKGRRPSEFPMNGDKKLGRNST